MNDAKLFVGNLPYSVRDAELEQAFSKAGTVVSATVMVERDNPSRSRGFGFVEMASADDAQAAISMWHEQELDGRAIMVNVARPREDRPARDHSRF